MLFSLLFAPFVAAIPHNSSYPLTVGDNGRYFTTSDSQPFFWQADTAWAFFHRLNTTEAATYLDDRASKGFNMLLAVGVSMFGPTDRNRAGDLPLIDFDITKPNPPYWSHVDELYSMAWDKGIRIAMVPAWGYYIHNSDNTPGVGNVSVNDTTAYAFGQWFGARYPDSPKILVADTNPWWTNKTAVANDYQNIGGVPPEYKFTDWGPIYDKFANGLRDGSRSAGAGESEQMITIHPTNQWFSGGPIAIASAFFGDRDWLTFDASQSGHSDFPPNPPIPWWNARRGYEPIEYMYNANKTRPVLDNEAHYEARYDNGKSNRPYWNASDVRKGSFQAAFSGAAGVTYGANSVMQFQNPAFYANDTAGVASPWYDEIHLPGSSQMVNIKTLLTDRKSYPYLVPDSSFIQGDLLKDDNKTMGLRAEDNSALLVYTPLGGTLKVDTSCLGTGFGVKWFDPVFGEYSGGNGTDPSGAIWTFTPPQSSNHTDWALVLEK